jgi:hypothetical protein
LASIKNLDNFLNSAVQTSNAGQRRVSSVLIEPLGKIVDRLKAKSDELIGLDPLDYIGNRSIFSTLKGILTNLSNAPQAINTRLSALNIENMFFTGVIHSGYQAAN